MIIAEIGLNHNGEIDLAKELVDAAIYAGADTVKFQTFADDTHAYPNINLKETYEMALYCKEKGIKFMSAPHDYDAIGFVDVLVDTHKIASPFIHDEAFVKHIDESCKPIMMSTGNPASGDGMATYDEIVRVISWIKNSKEVWLLHCVSQYPCKNPHYERIEELKKLCLNVGLSDHSKTIKVPKVPVIEKHIMLEDMDCVDKEVSLTPNEFKEMVEWLKSS